MSRTDEELRATLDRISKERATMKPGEYPEEQPTPPMTKTQELEVVAWRVKDFADGWMLSNIETTAIAYKGDGHLVEPLVTLSAASTTIEGLEAEIERINANALDQVSDLTLRAEAAEADRDALRKALEPFAEAAENLDDNHGDNSPIWESPAAMGIDAKHLRAARKALEASK